MTPTRFSFVVFALALASIGVISRLIEHTPNFAPITALALISGYYLRSKWSLGIPLLAMFASDVVIGFYSAPVMVSVYGSYLLAWVLARRAADVSALALRTLVSSFAFFLITNAAVWAFTTMYAKTVGGLMQSYVMAIPFFRASFASDLLFTAAFVLVMETALAWRAKQINAYGKA